MGLGASNGDDESTGPTSLHEQEVPEGLDQIRATLRDAAEVHGTPLFVIDAAAIDAAASRVEAAFPDPWLRLYSLKANDLPAICERLGPRGWGASAVSTGEWAQARAGGLRADAVSIEGIGKTDWQLAQVVEAARHEEAVRWIAVESRDELAALVALLRTSSRVHGVSPVLDVLLRLNPQTEPETVAGLAVGRASSKFGMTREEILEAAASDAFGGTSLSLRGVHVHVGSQLGGVAAWAQAGVQAVRLCGELEAGVHGVRAPNCDTVDFGGGFPLADTGAPGPEDFRAALDEALDMAGLALPPRPAVEPGRYVVGRAGWLLASVLHVRSGRGTGPQVVLDAGMTELIRPALYGARHAVVALATAGSGPRRPTAVEGPICETTDSLGTHLLPPLHRGDLVVIADAGAYAASFSSRYNGRPVPTEVMVEADGWVRSVARVPLARPPRRDAAAQAPSGVEQRNGDNAKETR